MGGKQNRQGKHFYLFLTCVIIALALLSGCAHVYEELIAQRDFDRAENLVKQGNYNAAASKYEQILTRHPRVGEEILFQAGLLYVSPRNQHKDYQKSLECFQRLINNHPDSRYRPESDVLAHLIGEILHKDKKLGTQRKQIEEMEKKLELMKEVDMNLKQKKKTYP